MKKRLQIGKLLKGDKRLEGETFVEYKERLKLEKSLLNDYGKGVYISPEQHQQDVKKKYVNKMYKMNEIISKKLLDKVN